MTIHIRYFAVLRDRRGLPEESVTVEPCTARQLVDSLVESHELGLPSALIRVAVNGDFVSGERLLNEGDSLVLIPPVAGG